MESFDLAIRASNGTVLRSYVESDLDIALVNRTQRRKSYFSVLASTVRNVNVNNTGDATGSQVTVSLLEGETLLGRIIRKRDILFFQGGTTRKYQGPYYVNP